MDLASRWISGVWVNSDEAKARTTIPGPVADIFQISRHRGAMQPSGARVRVDAFAFVKGDHQERGHKRKRNGAA